MRSSLFQIVVYEGNDIAGVCAGKEDFREPGFFEAGDIFQWDNATAKEEDINLTLLFEAISDSGEEDVVCTTKAAKADYIDIFLDCGGNDLLRGLADTCVDYFHPCIAKGTRYYFRATVVTIKTGLSDEDTNYFAHISSSLP